MIPFVKGLYVQDLAVANFQLAVTDYILYLEASDGESLPCAHLSQHGSDVVRGEQRLGCRFRAGDDEFATGEQKDRAVRAHKAQGDGRKLFSIERGESKDLIQSVQLQWGRGLDLRGGHYVMDKRDRFAL